MSDFKEFFNAIIAGDFEDVKKKYKDEYLLMANGSGWTPLHRACYQGNTDIVTFLINKGSNIESETKFYRWRPLHAAAYYGQSAAIELLIGSGCLLDQRTQRKETAFDMAVRENREECARILDQAMKLDALCRRYRSPQKDKELPSVLRSAEAGDYGEVGEQKLISLLFDIITIFNDKYKEKIFRKILMKTDNDKYKMCVCVARKEKFMLGDVETSKTECFRMAVTLLGRSTLGSGREYLVALLIEYLGTLSEVSLPNEWAMTLTETFLISLYRLWLGRFKYFDGKIVATLMRFFKNYDAIEAIKMWSAQVLVVIINRHDDGAQDLRGGNVHIKDEEVREVVAYLQKVEGRKISTLSRTDYAFLLGPVEQVEVERAVREKLKPSLTDYERVELLGERSHTAVYRCMDRQNKLHFAVREVTLGTKEDDVRVIGRDIKQYAEWRYCRRTIRHFGVTFSDGILKVFMEYVSRGSLRNMINKYGPVLPEHIAKYSLQILEGLTFIHQNRVVHGDLRAANVLLEDEDNIKLSDFGMGKYLGKKTNESLGDLGDIIKEVDRTSHSNIYWMAPEVVKDGDFTQRSDIWSLGATVLEMLTGQPPYHDLNLPCFLNKMVSLQTVDYRSPQEVPMRLHEFIHQMLVADPSERASVDMMLRSPFIREVLVPSLDYYVTEHSLGEGSYGEVFKCSDGGTSFVVGELASATYGATEEVRGAIHNEIDRYSRLKYHERIVRYFGAAASDGVINIYRDYMAGGSLRTKIDNEGPLPPSVIASYCHQILEGLTFLHRNNIIHMDIRASNILLEDDDNLRLCDFGISKYLKARRIERIRGTDDGGIGVSDNRMVILALIRSFHWMAPEVVNGGDYSERSDLWSLGITVIEMLTGNPPYFNLSHFDALERIAKYQIVQFKSLQEIPTKMQAFLDLMLAPMPTDRAKVDKLLHSPFIRDTLVPSLVYFEKMDLLGRGCYGDVYRCCYRKYQLKFAVKEVPIGPTNSTNENIDNIKKEIYKFQKLTNNERILKYFGVTESRGVLNIFMEHSPGGSLKSRLYEEGPLSPEVIARYSKQILEGLGFLHLHNIIHGDLKGSNILLEGDEHIKLCDFGIRKYSERGTLLGSRGTDILENAYYWMAPEVIQGEACNELSDIWSLGATVVEMLTGRPPYHNLSPSVAREKIITSTTTQCQYLSDVPTKLQRFIETMLVRDVLRRPTVEMLHQSSFIQELLVPSLDDYEKLGLLGRGAYGHVYKCYDRRTKTFFVVKEVSIVTYKTDDEGVEGLKNEINIYSKLKYHERILRYFGTTKNDRLMNIFMEYIPGGSLKTKLDESGPFQAGVIARYTKQILEGLDFLHDKMIIHRDIKAANILRSEDDNIKLCDFGVSKCLSTTAFQSTQVTTPIQSLSGNKMANTVIGTSYWMAPEVIKGQDYSIWADVWSLGATVVEMLTGNPPYHQYLPLVAMFHIGTTQAIEYESPHDISQTMRSFLTQMFVINPLERATVQTLLNSDFILQT